MNKNLWVSFFLCFLSGCVSSSPWICDSLTASSSKRLIHIPETGYPPWKIEFLKLEDTVELFVSATQHPFQALGYNKQHIYTALRIKDDEGVKILEDTSFLFEGGMKAHISPSLASACIEALQEGKKVSILVGTLEETLEPDFFKERFSKFLTTSSEWYTNIKTPLD